MPASAHVFWLFGLSGAGKSTLADRLAAELRAGSVPVLALDGDRLRTGLCRELGFSDADRAENLRRAAAVARLALDSGLNVVASFITPAESHRRLVAETIGADRLSLIWIDAPVGLCRERDVKGLYAAATAGRIGQMTGVSAPFEPPPQTDLTLDTARHSPEASAKLLGEFARRMLGLA